jgi:hypothetical protein
MTIGEDGNVTPETFEKPAVIAAPLNVTLYRVGLPVVAVNGRDALVVPDETDGLAPSEIVTTGGCVIVTDCVLVQELASVTVQT